MGDIASRRRGMMGDILTERPGGILRFELNRPERKNAITSSMYLTLAGLLDEAGKDDRVRVVLLHGAGDSFTAGNDLRDLVENPPGPGDSPQTRLITVLMDFDKPIIAAVRGAAVGLGTTILTHVDFAYAAESARFQMPFINRGLVPEVGSSYSLPALVGYIRAAELIMLGTPFDAARALDMGIVTAVVPDDALMDTATETARKLAEKPPEALRDCKRQMKWATRELVEEAAKVEREEFAERVRSPEAKEAFAAFFEKRPPDFTSTSSTAGVGKAA
jgi:enoyl-CoA hydratase/carnithine racemase